ncbi:ankyrin repeat protein, partial [Xylona heveae TC161]
MQLDSIGETALHIAARNNCVLGARRLLLAQADVNAQTNHGWTPLQLAARHGHSAMVSVLLHHGANCHLHGFHGYTAMHYAARSGHHTVVKQLIESGACAEALDNDKKTPVDEAWRFQYQNTLEILLRNVS